MESGFKFNDGGNVVDFTDIFVERDTLTYPVNNLYVTGNNAWGQLGDGTLAHKSTPTQIGTSNDWAWVESGHFASSGIKNDGTLWFWGHNGYGKWGMGTNDPGGFSSPVQVGSLTDWKQTAGGVYHMAAVKTDGTLWTWGMGSSRYIERMIGNGGSNAAVSTPVQIGNLTTWNFISKGIYAVHAIKTDGTLWGWGQSNSGGLGNGNYGILGSVSTPVQIGTGTNWAFAAGGGEFTMGIKTDGTLWGWGMNTNYETGQGPNVNTSTPIQVGSATNWATVACSWNAAIALKTDNTLWTWGWDHYGQQGLGTRQTRVSPIQIGANTWKKITAASHQCLAIRSDDTLWGWGDNESGQLGDGTVANKSSPTQIGSLTNWKEIAAANNTTLAVKTDGTLWSWGYGGYGQLGNGTLGSTSSPAQIGTDTNWTKVYTSIHTLFAQKADGTVWGWGYNPYGETGNGTSVIYISTPVQVGTATNWKTIAPRDDATAAIKTDGTLWGWGLNNSLIYGWLGQSNVLDYWSAIQVGTATDWEQVDCGDYFTIARKKDGTVWSIGGVNWGGHLADGTNVMKSSPQQIGSLTNWKSIACGANYTSAIKTDGSIWGWGWNSEGQLGDGTNTFRMSPIQIGNGTFDWKSSTGYHACHAIKKDGSLWGWGWGGWGVQGQGNTNINQFTPKQIGLLYDWRTVHAGVTSIYAIKKDGTLWAWGENTNGQLGDGTTTSVSSPIQAIGTGWRSMEAGWYQTLLLK